MANLQPIELSKLPTIEEAESFFVFASKGEGDSFESGKVNFTDLQEAVKKLQLERRIALNMEGSTHSMYVGEKMTIYKISSSNVKDLKINGISVPAKGNTNIQIEADSFIHFSLEKPLTDPVSYLFIFAKALL